MAIIDVVKWDGTPDVFAYKFPEENLTTFTQLIVNESQEAVLFHKGKLLQRFSSGKHTLSTENIPILENLYGIPFGGKNPFTAEVWFVNKVNSLDIKWGTRTPLQLRDPGYNVVVPVRGFGQFGVQIGDSEKFLVGLVGTLPVFDKENLNDYFKGVLLTKASSIIAKKITADKISVLDIAMHLSDISSFIQDEISVEFEKFGIKIVNFYVNSINVSDEDEAVVHLKQILSKKAEMDILGYTYQQERSFDVLQGAAQNEGMAGNIMGAGMGLGMGVGVGGSVGGMMNSVGQNISSNISGQMINCPKCKASVPSNSQFCSDCGTTLQSKEKQKSISVLCDKCQKEIPSNSKFCPYCGDVYNPCPACGADNTADAVVCSKCNAAMPEFCPKCNCKVEGSVKFCPECGSSFMQQCSKCNSSFKNSFKYCPTCGEEIK